MKEYIVRCENNEFTIEREIVRCKECRNRHRQHRCAGRHPNWFCGDGVKDEITIQTGQTYGKSANVAGEVVDFNNMISCGGRIRNLPPVEPKPATDDCISRQEAIEEIASHDPTNGTEPYFSGHEVIDILKCVPTVTHGKHTETHACDCISRQAAIDAVEKAVFKGVAKSAIESLPPAEPERPRGEWHLVDHLWECDRCQYRQNKSKPTNFCPNCGADMRGEEE